MALSEALQESRRAMRERMVEQRVSKAAMRGFKSPRGHMRGRAIRSLNWCKAIRVPASENGRPHLVGGTSPW